MNQETRRTLMRNLPSSIGPPQGAQYPAIPAGNKGEGMNSAREEWDRIKAEALITERRKRREDANRIERAQQAERAKAEAGKRGNIAGGKLCI